MAKIRTPAVAYLRTSSAANVGTDLGSERRQRVAIPAFAERAGFEIADDDWYYDAAGSGAASDRGPRRLRQAAMPHRLYRRFFRSGRTSRGKRRLPWGYLHMGMIGNTNAPFLFVCFGRRALFLT